MQKSSNLCYNSLTSNEKEALNAYAMGEYQNINDYLNGKFEGYPNTKEVINQIDIAMSKYTLKENLTTYRGTNGKYYENYNVGDIIEESMYISTSLSEGIAKTFADDKHNATIMEIKVPKNTSCIYIGDNGAFEFEAELLLARNLKYKVLEKKKDILLWRS